MEIDVIGDDIYYEGEKVAVITAKPGTIREEFEWAVVRQSENDYLPPHVTTPSKESLEDSPAP
jgi:hypothetical protein